jgi:hypothetical protein
VLDLTVLRSSFADLDAAARRADPDLIGYQSSARGLRTGIVATYATGAVVALVGGALWLFAPRGAPAPRTLPAR